MEEKNHYIAILIGKYLDGSLDANEQIVLDEWINASDNNRHLFAELSDGQQLMTHLQRFYAYDGDRIARKIGAQIPAFATPPRTSIFHIHSLRKWGWAAAAVAMLLGGATWFWVNHTSAPTTLQASNQAVIVPGKEGAILTLADGRQVSLDSMGNGVVTHQSGASVVMSNGKLIYDAAGESASSTEYNKMTTPKGRQFQVTLPDGTRVWLNAASSIRYPTAFTGQERRVEVTGEVYFEVAKDANKPFLVNINNKGTIEVLGTSFNVNAYENENSIRTTLLDGSVRVAVSHANSVILEPGQQASIGHTTGLHMQEEKVTVLNNPDLEKIMAWKNNLFNFENADLGEVMRQLERWYNIDVVYENGIPDEKFKGEMSRQIALADLLVILRKTEVDFRVEGRTLIVLNNK
ncbi:FecR domain-containing protein [Chitinophaga sp. RAB17]|uniref:FecR domain-containing protein n=1 Tax=Chitinophaga sp. RAB17 TaxID=3233049 RepID=UPI003F9324C9